MPESEKKIIAFDIDDVVANTSEAVRVWVNEQTGKELSAEDYYIDTDADYWHYYGAVWKKHGIELDLNKYLSIFSESQEGITMMPGAKEAFDELRENFRIVFVTSRDSATNDATQKWFLDNLGYEVVVHFASAGHHVYGMHAPSKGEIVKSLGASVLFDDNPEHVKSALDHGVDGVLFGHYGWQQKTPVKMRNIKDWAGVLEYLRDKK